jgi:hypothetical protein
VERFMPLPILRSIIDADEAVDDTDRLSVEPAFAADQARREALREQLGPEQAAIAEQQELSGLGETLAHLAKHHRRRRSGR